MRVAIKELSGIRLEPRHRAAGWTKEDQPTALGRPAEGAQGHEGDTGQWTRASRVPWARKAHAVRSVDCGHSKWEMEPSLVLLFAFATRSLRADSLTSALRVILGTTRSLASGFPGRPGGGMHRGHSTEEVVFGTVFKSCLGGTSLNNWALGEKDRRKGVKGDF